MKNDLKVTIITATFNSEGTLEDTFSSVLGQTYPNIEHVIVDGGSTDRTMEMVLRHAPGYGGRLRWVSEKDDGIYDALNKGIRMATGDIIGFLHSDDFFGSRDAIEKIVRRSQETECDGVYGDLVFVDPHDIRKAKRIWIAGKGRFEWGWTIPHQTIYLKKDVYERFGGYLTDMRNAADNEFILRVCKDGKINLSYIKEVLVVMKLGGASTKNISSNKRGFQEVQRSLKMHGIRYPYIVNTLRIVGKISQVLRAKVTKYKVEI